MDRSWGPKRVGQLSTCAQAHIPLSQRGSGSGPEAGANAAHFGLGGAGEAMLCGGTTFLPGFLHL